VSGSSTWCRAAWWQAAAHWVCWWTYVHCLPWSGRLFLSESLARGHLTAAGLVCVGGCVLLVGVYAVTRRLTSHSSRLGSCIKFCAWVVAVVWWLTYQRPASLLLLLSVLDGALLAMAPPRGGGSASYLALRSPLPQPVRDARSHCAVYGKGPILDRPVGGCATCGGYGSSSSSSSLHVLYYLSVIRIRRALCQQCMGRSAVSVVTAR
jgi:hypothetical protein